MSQRGEMQDEIRIEVDPPSIGWQELRDLIASSYAYMSGRIDPPSSLLAMTAADLERKAVAERLVVASIGGALVGCIFCRPQADWLYVGKMAVAPDRQRSGVGRLLVDAARGLACALDLRGLELETRIELTENHRAFGRLGFVKVAERSHPGYTKITSVMMRSPVGSTALHTLTRPIADIAAVRASHRRLHAAITELAADSVARPSRLPGWTVGHVLTHLARNADSVVRRLDGAERGEVVAQYQGGASGRQAEIEAGAGRPLEAIVADLVAADGRLDEVFTTTSDGAWNQPVEIGGGGRSPAAELAFARWREVEIHHVDLGVGYEPEHWPTELVERLLPRTLRRLPDRADAASLLAWTLGRAGPPELRPWG